jgi:CRISPR-associated protein Csb2
MRSVLLLAVRFQDGRYHGAGDWPPSPGRLFQALVAGAARGSQLTEADRAALGWLETLAPPIIIAPITRAARGFATFVPNNDLDVKEGDPDRIGEIRARKVIHPWLFDASVPLLYAWEFTAGNSENAWVHSICTIADLLYQFGGGVDMAWAQAEIIDEDGLEARMHRDGVVTYRPASADGGVELACPTSGLLVSLEQRFAQQRTQFLDQRIGRKVQKLFTRPPTKPLLRMVKYNSPPTRLLFDIRKLAGFGPTADFAPQTSTRVVALVERLRDGAAERLRQALPDDPHHAALVERVFVGRNADDADKAARIRIIPLPSIGHTQANQSIRRVLVEVPPNCPFASADIGWSFDGLDLIDTATGEIFATLSAATQRTMLRHYGLSATETRRVWRTVTPAALPERAARRRIDPQRLADPAERKDAPERLAEEGRAVAAVRAALRHAMLGAAPAWVRVQREPFSARGTRVEAFAAGTRFAKERLWHVEITFAGSAQAPVVIGDGRYLGLGIMAPVRERKRDVLVFGLGDAAGLTVGDRESLLLAVRRALMSRARTAEGGVPRLFSGHEDDGSPAASGQHDHVFLAADGDRDGRIQRLIVAAPWECDRAVRAEPATRRLFGDIVSGLREVRAGRLGVLALEGPEEATEGDPIVGPARIWRTHTAFTLTRYAKRHSHSRDAFVADVRAECERRGLSPLPRVEVGLVLSHQRAATAAQLVLHFPEPVRGPILLGRDSHRGGGLFRAIR